MATIRTSPPGIEVLPHVQAFADAVETATGVDSFGTYAGHDPTPERATDIFVPVNDPAPGNSVCNFAIANWDYYGLWYIIFRQRIYNPSIANYWRDMAQRGDLNHFDYTQNHYDHVHASFYSEAEAKPDRGPAAPVFDLNELAILADT